MSNLHSILVRFIADKSGQVLEINENLHSILVRFIDARMRESVESYSNLHSILVRFIGGKEGGILFTGRIYIPFW